MGSCGRTVALEPCSRIGRRAIRKAMNNGQKEPSWFKAFLGEYREDREHVGMALKSLTESILHLTEHVHKNSAEIHEVRLGLEETNRRIDQTNRKLEQTNLKLEQ